MKVPLLFCPQGPKTAILRASRMRTSVRENPRSSEIERGFDAGDKLYPKARRSCVGFGDNMKIAFVEWPEGLSVGDARWGKLKESISAARPDILVTNELPFGPWLADEAVFSREAADRSIHAHQQGVEGLSELNLPAIISSRPVWDGERLANEAFALEKGFARPFHRKHYFPNEPGWFESEWYAGNGSGFDVAEVLGIKVGVLLCTDAMFNEHARAYGRQKASLIVIPRASGNEYRVVENRGRHGVARFRFLRRELKSGRPFERQYGIRRRRFRLCAARPALIGDISYQSCAGVRSRPKIDPHPRNSTIPATFRSSNKSVALWTLGTLRATAYRLSCIDSRGKTGFP